MMVRWIFNNDESIVFCCVSWCYKVGIIVYKTFFGKSTGLFRRTLYFPIFSMWKTDRSAMGYGKGKVEMLILILLRAILLVGW